MTETIICLCLAQSVSVFCHSGSGLTIHPFSLCIIHNDNNPVLPLPIPSHHISCWYGLRVCIQINFVCDVCSNTVLLSANQLYFIYFPTMTGSWRLLLITIIIHTKICWKIVSDKLFHFFSVCRLHVNRIFFTWSDRVHSCCKPPEFADCLG